MVRSLWAYAMKEKKLVICYRCLTVYDRNTAPLTRTTGLQAKEPACPKCGCKVCLG
ncbi:hypothetical protein PHYNN_178 [Pantoea phage Phynn]|nr:hypothetical protein PHYNN_178 [Pantoea phage Phynn]